MRVNNSVILLGVVVSGVKPKYTKEGKARATYQIRLDPRSIDKGLVHTPFIKSIGNQAEKDIATLKVGDLVLIEGRISTRTERKDFTFIKNPESENPKDLIVYDAEDPEAPYVTDDEIYTATLERPVTEIIAVESYNITDFLNAMPKEQRLKSFNSGVLKAVLEESEKTGTDVLELLKENDLIKEKK